ncbi:endonuclease/exonuclease/phosphatase family protein [Ningiella sp. W23]|uniref:endonuclease/exonuclease/phosphatase family protein n=1 Tax=Ningiella sp. W23 TaxID=3023715 RepID=UPI003756E78D
MTLILAITTALVFAFTFLPLLPSQHWAVRVWEFPRLQILFLSLLNLTALLYVYAGAVEFVLASVSLLCIAYQAYWVVPFSQLFPKEVKTAYRCPGCKKISVLTSNVLMPNRSSNKLIDLVLEHSPDILVTLESDEWWENALEELHDDYPYRVPVPKGNLYGMHVYSKLELRDVEVSYLVEEDVPSVSCKAMLNEDFGVHCYFVHPAPPSPTENDTAKPRDIELLKIAEQVEPDKYPTIVTGDLNDVAWSPTTRKFKQVSGLKDPRVGRAFLNTFHVKYPIARWPLDHIFHSHHFSVSYIGRLPSIDSDHFPLLSELIIEADD